MTNNESTPKKPTGKNPAAADHAGRRFVDPDTGDILEGEITDAQREKLLQAYNAILEKNNVGQSFEELNKAVSAILETATSALSTDKLRDMLQELRENLKPAQDLLNEIEELEPYLNAELKKPEYGGATIDSILESHTQAELLELRNDPESLFYKALEAAKAVKREAARITVQRADNIEYPLDKISGKAWNLFTENTDGQLAITFDLLPKKKSLQATAYYAINFDNLGNNLQITKRLLPFDKRVYIAVSALFNAGNDVITATQIYYAMGNTGKPASNQIKKIDDALSKMTNAHIILDNAQESEALKGKYPHFVYEGSLLPIEKITAIVNGQVSESAIHIFREPPLMTFAKERKQVTTIDVALLQSPINKTDANLSIDDYLIDRISKAKNGKSKSCRILYKTLYDHAGIKTKPQRLRAPEKIKKYLDYYQQQGFIKRHDEQADGVTVYF